MHTRAAELWKQWAGQWWSTSNETGWAQPRGGHRWCCGWGVGGPGVRAKGNWGVVEGAPFSHSRLVQVQ